MNEARDEAVRAIKAMDRARLRKLVGELDGHSISVPADMMAAGWPAEVVSWMTQEHRSGKDHKQTIYVGGSPTASLRGVSHLGLLYFLSSALDAKYEPKLGRGSQAWSIVQGIRRKLDGEE